jgi:valyl-tRNA synthetase
MMTAHFTGQVPFKHGCIHGLVKDAQGKIAEQVENSSNAGRWTRSTASSWHRCWTNALGLRKPETTPAVRKQFPAGIPPAIALTLRFTFAEVWYSINSKRCEGYRNFATNSRRDAVVLMVARPRLRAGCIKTECALPGGGFTRYA